MRINLWILSTEKAHSSRSPSRKYTHFQCGCMTDLLRGSSSINAVSVLRDQENDDKRNVLELFPNEAGSFFATNVTASLFNGNILLGTYFSASCCVPTFRSPSSLFQAGSATADFTAIDAGITNGIIDVSIGTGMEEAALA